MQTRTLKLLLPILLMATGLQAQTLSRNETVYVNLDSCGQASQIEVVTWLRNDGHGPASDQARLSKLRNIKGLDRPTVSQDRINFNSRATNIFYKGIPNRHLPITARITYFLNGKPVEHKDLTGKRGKLRVRVELTNRTGVQRRLSYTEVGTGQRRSRTETVYTPFVVQVSTGLKIDNFSSVEPGDGVFAVVGDTFKLSWIALPLPQSTIEFTAEATKIEMPALMITAVPKALPLPAQYRAKLKQLPATLNRLYAGVGEVGGYLDELRGGADQLGAGARQLKAGHQRLAAATPQLSAGTAQLIQATEAQLALLENVRTINGGIKTRLAPLARFSGKVGEINKALDASSEVADLTMTGGSFTASFLKFLDAQAKPRPPVSEFPASIAAVQAGARKLNAGATELDLNAARLLDGSTRLADGSASLSTNIAKLKHDGTDRIRAEIVDESTEAMLIMARLAASDRAAQAYDRFAGRPSPVKSSVAFIMKTPGSFAQ